MDILPVNPSPAETSEYANGTKRNQSEDFVDEAVVRSFLIKGPYERLSVRPEKMAMFSSQDDYAGWTLSLR